MPSPREGYTVCKSIGKVEIYDIPDGFETTQNVVLERLANPSMYKGRFIPARRTLDNGNSETVLLKITQQEGTEFIYRGFDRDTTT